LKPKLFHCRICPRNAIELRRGQHSFQGWEAVSLGNPEDNYATLHSRTCDLAFDSGAHHVGYLTFRMEVEGPVDSPFRRRTVFGEHPAELMADFDSYQGPLGRGWLQDEILTVEEFTLHGIRLAGGAPGFTI